MRVPERSLNAKYLPGDLLLHPLALTALAVLVVNDHLLKGHGWSLVTGKLSDIAGLVFFPLLLVSLGQLVRFARGTRNRTNRVLRGDVVAAPLVVAIVVTAVGFAAVKVCPAAAHAYSTVIGLRVRADVTDLLALPALALAWWIGGSRQHRPENASVRAGAAR